MIVWNGRLRGADAVRMARLQREAGAAVLQLMPVPGTTTPEPKPA